MLLRHTTAEVKEREGPDHQPGQDLPAHRGHVRGPGDPRLHAPQPRLPGLLLLPPQHLDPALQGAGHGRHQLLHRGRLGVRRPGQPAAGHPTIFTVYDPDVIAVHTTCLSETIGDDITQMTAKAIEDGKVPEGKIVIQANTPSYVGSPRHRLLHHGQGHGDHFAGKHGPAQAGQINIIPGYVEPSDMEEIKRLTARDGGQDHPVPRHLRRAERPHDRQVPDVSRRRRHGGGTARHRRQPGHPGPGPHGLGGRGRSPGCPSARCPARSWTCPSASRPPTRSSTPCGRTAMVERVRQHWNSERGQLLDVMTDMHQYFYGERWPSAAIPTNWWP